MLVMHGSCPWKESDGWLQCNRALASQTALFNYIGWGDAWPVKVVEQALTASFKCKIMDSFHGTHSFISRQKCYREREINIDTFGQVGDHSEEFCSVWAIGASISSSWIWVWGRKPALIRARMFATRNQTVLKKEKWWAWIYESGNQSLKIHFSRIHNK